MSRGERQPSDSLDRDYLVQELLAQILNVVSFACHHYGYQADKGEMEDLCQDTILFLIDQDCRRLRLFRHESSFKTWLEARVRHHLCNCLHRQKRTESLDELSPDSIIYQPAQEETVFRAERLVRLRLAKPKLTEREQELFGFCCRDDLSAVEIAGLMGIKVDSFHRSKHSLIKKIQRILGILPSCEGSLRKF